MKRKEFLKTACTACIAIGTGMITGSLGSCSNMPIYKTKISKNRVSVPRTLFDQNKTQIIRPQGFEFDIAVRKETDDTFSALLMRCTHADNQVIPTGSGFVCNLHGSRFDARGQVTKSPAEKPLKSYKTEVQKDNVVILLI